jgi:hypothetical protein
MEASKYSFPPCFIFRCCFKIQILVTENCLQESTWRVLSFGGVAPCGFIINWRFGGTCHLYFQGRRICEQGKVFSFPSFLCVFSTLEMEATRSSETQVYNKPTSRHIPEDGILHSHCCDNLKSCICNNAVCTSVVTDNIEDMNVFYTWTIIDSPQFKLMSE